MNSSEGCALLNVFCVPTSEGCVLLNVFCEPAFPAYFSKVRNFGKVTQTHDFSQVPQNVIKSGCPPIRPFLSSRSILAISSSESSKSKISAFEIILSGVTDFGMVTTPFWISQRKTICTGFLPYLARLRAESPAFCNTPAVQAAKAQGEIRIGSQPG